MTCLIKWLAKTRHKLSSPIMLINRPELTWLPLLDSQKAITGFPKTATLGHYLGTPLIGRVPKNRDYQHLIDKVTNKLAGWKIHQLSLAGRITLGKAVIQALPTYSMMNTLIPKGVINNIQKKLRSFIWGDQPLKKKYHAVNWRTMMLPKKHGGLAMSNLLNMNKACIMKLGWMLRTGSKGLWCEVIRRKYAKRFI